MAHVECFSDDPSWDYLLADRFIDDFDIIDDLEEGGAWSVERPGHAKNTEYTLFSIGTGAGATENPLNYDPLIYLETSLEKEVAKSSSAWGRLVRYLHKYPPRSSSEIQNIDRTAISLEIVALAGERIWRSEINEQSETLASVDVVQEILELRSGWDGEPSIAPSSETKSSFVAIAGYLSDYLPSAEFEVDPSDGGVSLRWFSRDDSQLVSVDVRPTGNVIVIGTRLGDQGFRRCLSGEEVGRVLRTAIDAGLTRLDDRLP